MSAATELSLPTAKLSWRSDAPFSEDFDDIYFNPQAAIAESLAVFIEPTQLAKRWQQKTSREFSIIETGFGAGVNFLLAATTFAQHAQAPTWLHYTAIEAYPLRHDDLLRIHNHLDWHDKSLLSHLLLHFPPAVRGVYRICWPHQRICLTLWWMDLAEALPQLTIKADAWFLDGFAPSKNPAMWSETIYPQLARCSNPKARFATFTAASHVRNGLHQAGFAVHKVKGFGLKRHRLEGYWPEIAHHQPDAYVTDAQQVTIIGSGISGCVTARAFAEQGHHVRVIDADPQIAGGASGNSQAALFTQLSIHNSPYNQFQHACYAFARQVIQPSRTAWPGLQPCGLINLPAQVRDFRKQAQLTENELWPADWIQMVTAAAASDLAGVPITQSGMFYPLSARIHPSRLCRYLLAHPRIEVITQQHLKQLQWTAPYWRLHLDSQILNAELLILCTALATSSLLNNCRLSLRPMRGQLTELPANPFSKSLRCIVSGQTYVMPEHGGHHVLGATYDANDLLDDVRHQDHLRNLSGITTWSPALYQSFMDGPPNWLGRAAVRCQTPDYLPLIGPVSAIDVSTDQPYENLLIHCGQGSRGFTQAWLGAEILLGYISNRGFPVSETARLAVHPNRFQQRFLRRQPLRSSVEVKKLHTTSASADSYNTCSNNTSSNNTDSNNSSGPNHANFT